MWNIWSYSWVYEVKEILLPCIHYKSSRRALNIIIDETESHVTRKFLLLQLVSYSSQLISSYIPINMVVDAGYVENNVLKCNSYRKQNFSKNCFYNCTSIWIGTNSVVLIFFRYEIFRNVYTFKIHISFQITDIMIINKNVFFFF